MFSQYLPNIIHFSPKLSESILFFSSNIPFAFKNVVFFCTFFEPLYWYFPLLSILFFVYVCMCTFADLANQLQVSAVKPVPDCPVCFNAVISRHFHAYLFPFVTSCCIPGV